MYIPKQYQGKSRNDAITFIQRYNFGIIVSSAGTRPIATHLPFTVMEKGNQLLLFSHFARANEQLNQLNDQEVLIIFSEPHAYISPRFYNKKENVPTWNYLSVHAYGKVRLLHKESEKMEVLERMILDLEPDYKKQWDDLSGKYKSGMSRGIVAFEIKVEELQYKEKLSQNKKEQERQNIIDAFSQSQHDHEREIAKYMNRDQ